MQTVSPHGAKTVFIKTAKGHAEIAQRHHGLNSRQRRVLIVMGGTRSLEALTCMIPKAELEEIIPYLARQSFIVTAEDSARQQLGQQQPETHRQEAAPAPISRGAAPSAEKLREVKDFMTITAQTYLGLLAAGLIQRIERAGDAEQLLGVVGHWHMALHGSRQGGRFAQPYLEQVRKALGAA